MIPSNGSKVKFYASKEGSLGIGVKGVVLGVGEVDCVGEVLAVVGVAVGCGEVGAGCG